MQSILEVKLASAFCFITMLGILVVCECVRKEERGNKRERERKKETASKKNERRMKKQRNQAQKANK